MEKIKAKKSRRNFIKQSLTALAGTSVLSLAFNKIRASDLKKTRNKKKFIYRKFGKTDFTFPIVSMGAVNTNNPNLVKAALDAGIVYFDTGYYYQQGRNEEMLGEVFKERPRDTFFISSKVMGDRENQINGTFTAKTNPKNFIKKFETSLKRLKMDYVDIFLLHNVGSRKSALFEPLLNALIKIKKHGKARYLGVSTHINEPDVIQAAIDSEIYDVVMTAYNFRQPHNQDLKKAIAAASKAGLAVIAMKTQAGVYWDRERKHPINAKAALKWVLQDENVCTAIPGITNFEQLELDISVMEDLTLSDKEKNDLKLGQTMALTGLYCAQCGKCISQCRECLDIPTLMRSYMYAYGYRNSALAKETLQSVDLPNAPCTNCHTCTVTCSMGFDVRNKILDIVRLKDVPEDFLV